MKTRIIISEDTGWRLDTMLPGDRMMDRLAMLAKLWPTLASSDKRNHTIALIRELAAWDVSTRDIIEIVSHVGIGDQDRPHDCTLDDEARDQLSAILASSYFGSDDRTVQRPGAEYSHSPLFPENVETYILKRKDA